MALDDGGGDVGEFVSGVLGVVAEHRECLVGVDRVLVHQDALCLFDHGAASEGSLQAVVFGEALQRDVDRALQLFGGGVDDVGEDAAFGGFADVGFPGKGSKWRRTSVGAP